MTICIYHYDTNVPPIITDITMLFTNNIYHKILKYERYQF
jgi:hypothetical protein